MAAEMVEQDLKTGGVQERLRLRAALGFLLPLPGSGRYALFGRFSETWKSVFLYI